jgi:hypothetical protein
MNENEKSLFYSVLKETIIEEPSPELTSNIMHVIHKKVHKKMVTHKILEISGYILLGVVFIGFGLGYLFWYSDFKLPTLRINFEMPSKIYIIIASIIFVFSLIQLSFRKRLYENS